ncbi:hypothetical protein RHMOL_Rhmol09G0085100 [Rhododendron molle]|uniref:Uncharacterized protein n=1 Tax=Rhododendron molle TaxID=49168 RepID=A0ACC0MD33_RHOML|nr:hypothetical protein RHMOL_Rhmol09G0085100 [Rhododendron molle]
MVAPLSRSSSFISRSVVPGPAATLISLGAPDLVGDGSGQIIRRLLRNGPLLVVLVVRLTAVLGLVGGGGVVGVGGGPVVLFWAAADFGWIFQRYVIVYGFELWIPFDPLLSGSRLVLKYPRYRGACFGSRYLRSTFRLLWFFPVFVLKSVCPMGL